MSIIKSDDKPSLIQDLSIPVEDRLPDELELTINNKGSINESGRELIEDINTNLKPSLLKTGTPAPIIQDNKTPSELTNLLKPKIEGQEQCDAQNNYDDTNYQFVKPVDPPVQDGEIKKGGNLFFTERKEVSVFQLYCHLSGTCEIILMILGCIGSIGSGVASPLMSWLMGDVVNDFSGSNEGADKSIREEVMKGMTQTIKPMVNKLLIIGGCMFVFSFLSNFMWSYAGLRQIFRLKKSYFETILKQEQGWFDQNNAYEFATKVQAQLEQIEMGLGDRFGMILQSICQIVAGLVVAFQTSWNITLIQLCVSPAILFCLFYLMPKMRKFMILSRKTWEEAGGIAEEMLYDIKTIASFANFDFEMKRFNDKVMEVYEYDNMKSLRISLNIGLVMLFVFGSFVVAVFYGRTLIISHSYNDCTGRIFMPGDILTVIFSTLTAIMSFGSIAPSFRLISEAAMTSSDYFVLYERTPQIDLSTSTQKPAREIIKGRIEFKNIGFYYPSDKTKRKILNGLNFTIEPGQKVAFVGESGCGKSTTINLIERLYEPCEGEILIDGINIKNFDINHLRNLLGYVQQEPVLFNKSIRENIFFGREELAKELGDPEILMREACDQANASEFINNNREKYDYIVGVKGGKLSGGQKQRLAIARALLCKPKILILDEATSALDNKSEKEVQSALDKLGESTGKSITTLIIAHRLSTIINADVIFALKNGSVYEYGTHKELLEKGGYYANLIKSQLTESELEDKEENKISKLEKKKQTMRKMASKRVSTKYSRKVLEEEVQLLIEEKEKKAEVEVKYSELFHLLSSNIFDVILGSLAALCMGGMSPLSGWVNSNTVNALSNSDKNKMKKDTLKWGFIYLAVAVAQFLFTFLKMWKLESIGALISCKMRQRVIEKYLQLHLGYFDKDENSPGSLMTKLSIDTTALAPIIQTIVGDVVSCLGTIGIGLGLGFKYDWRLTLIALCFIPFIVAAQIITNKTRRGGREKDRKVDIEAGSVLSECVINTKTIFSFNFQKEAVKIYMKILERSSASFLKDSVLKGVFLGVGSFAHFASNATVYHFGAVFMEKGNLTYENMNNCINSVSTMSSGLTSGLRGLADFGKAKMSFKSVFESMNTQVEINAFPNDYEEEVKAKEEKNENKLSQIKQSRKDREDNLKINGKIEFRNVSFAYPTKPTILILKNISFVIEAGQSAALVGFSGCGKSTIIQLIQRYYEPLEGEILIDDINIKDYELYLLRKKIGIVSQEPVLFKRSVYENILYGKINLLKDKDKEEVKNDVLNYAKKARIEKFFNKGELGTKEDPVSGGEKQRIAIARAFLKNPSILLLDEATSALDKESEIEVQKSINELIKGRTSIAVAHRLSTIIDSDVIFCLEAGKIVEKGTHEELLRMNGKYKKLYMYSSTN